MSRLSQFGKANDRLSNLRSSSSSSEVIKASPHNSLHEAIADATATATQWQGERQPIESYHRYELGDSTEILPADSSSQRGGYESTYIGAKSIPDAHLPRYNDIAGGGQITILEHQFDGMEEFPCPGSPSPTSVYPGRATNDFGPKLSKRTASHFSLRSLTRSFKRPRLDIKRLASNVYRSSTRKMSRVRNLMRRQHEDEMRQYAAWKAQRRRSCPADPLKGKSEKGFGTFSMERDHSSRDDWWKEGVGKYHAPAWMKFDKWFHT